MTSCTTEVVQRDAGDNYYYAEEGPIKNFIILKVIENNYYFYRDNKEIAVWIFKNNGIIEKKWEKINGIVVRHYESGKIMCKMKFKDNLRHGEYVNYYETGEIKEEGFFEKDKPHGFYKKYDLAGKIIEKGYYENNKKEILYGGDEEKMKKDSVKKQDVEKMKEKKEKGGIEENKEEHKGHEEEIYTEKQEKLEI